MFQPIFNKYIEFSTGSYEASSSFSPLDTARLVNNGEWLYHQHSTQLRVNIIDDISMSLYPASIGSSSLLKSYGPFQINLDRDGEPLPLFLACKVSMSVSGSGTCSSSFDFYLRRMNGYGQTVSSEKARIFLTGSVYNTTTSLTATNQFSSIVLSGSTLETRTNNLFGLSTRLTGTINSPLVQKQVYLGYVDSYFTVLSSSNSNPVFACIYELFAREISVTGTQ